MAEVDAPKLGVMLFGLGLYAVGITKWQGIPALAIWPTDVVGDAGEPAKEPEVLPEQTIIMGFVDKDAVMRHIAGLQAIVEKIDFDEVPFDLLDELVHLERERRAAEKT